MRARDRERERRPFRRLRRDLAARAAGDALQIKLLKRTAAQDEGAVDAAGAKAAAVSMSPSPRSNDV